MCAPYGETACCLYGAENGVEFAARCVNGPMPSIDPYR